jgi:aminopeptidase
VEARFAELLAAYCLEAAPGETVLVEAETPALPLLPRLKRALLQRGAYPLFRLGYPGEARDFLLYGGRWLEAIPEVERALYEKADNWTYAASTCTGNRGLKSRLSLPAMSLRRHW